LRGEAYFPACGVELHVLLVQVPKRQRPWATLKMNRPLRSTTRYRPYSSRMACCTAPLVPSTPGDHDVHLLAAPKRNTPLYMACTFCILQGAVQTSIILALQRDRYASLAVRLAQSAPQQPVQGKLRLSQITGGSIKFIQSFSSILTLRSCLGFDARRIAASNGCSRSDCTAPFGTTIIGGVRASNGHDHRRYCAGLHLPIWSYTNT